MNRKVVIIEDEPVSVGAYQRAVSIRGFQVEIVKDTNGIGQIIDGDSHQDAAFFIVDVKIPPGTRYAKEITDGGNYTGIFVVRDLREKFPNVPIILWTQLPIREVDSTAKEKATFTLHCYYVRKFDIDANKLADLLEYYEKHGHFPGKLFRKLMWVVRLGTRWLGLTADIKEING